MESIKKREGGLVNGFFQTIWFSPPPLMIIKMGGMKNLDIELREISLTEVEYQLNKIAFAKYLVTGDSTNLSLKLKGFLREYLRKHKKPKRRER